MEATETSATTSMTVEQIRERVAMLKRRATTLRVANITEGVVAKGANAGAPFSTLQLKREDAKGASRNCFSRKRPDGSVVWTDLELGIAKEYALYADHICLEADIGFKVVEVPVEPKQLFTPEGEAILDGNKQPVFATLPQLICLPGESPQKSALNQGFVPLGWVKPTGNDVSSASSIDQMQEEDEALAGAKPGVVGN